MGQLRTRVFRHFDVIRRCGSIREAARHLHLSSSALNRQLLQWEAEIGSPLFDRLPAGLRLTPVGEIVANHVIHILHDAARMEGELAALSGMQRGTLEVVSVAALTPVFLPEVIQKMAERYPAIEIRVRIASSRQCTDIVAAGDADVALAFAQHKSAALRQLAVGGFALGAVVRADHPIARLRKVRFEECAGHPLVLPNAELSFHADLLALRTSLKRRLRIRLESASLDLMKGMAVRGLGVAFLNRFGIEQEIARADLVHVPLEPAILSYLGVYVRVDRALPPAIDAFARVAAEELDRSQGLETGVS
jgi:DNA-binding transcriptional LysR family regulator